VVSRAAEQAEGHHLRMKTVPMALTSSLYRDHLIADPTSEEEDLAASLVSTIVDSQGRILGNFAHILGVVYMLAVWHNASVAHLHAVVLCATADRHATLIPTFWERQCG
jgi:exosome complex RNA-binding protein Rrp42 (RNase PH superfamily)